jgi:hypothetical protein
VIARLPAGVPPVLLDLDFTERGGLMVTSPKPGSATGQAFAEDVLADCVLDAELGLQDAQDEDRYGLFFRQTAEERYVACTVNGAGRLALGLVDGGPPLVIADARLNGEVRFQSGVGVTNRFSVVMCGTMAAVMVNGVAVLGALLDARYVAGRVGALLVHTSSAPNARLVVRWAQARALIP